jgi:hypothetical protein
MGYPNATGVLDAASRNNFFSMPYFLTKVPLQAMKTVPETCMKSPYNILKNNHLFASKVLFPRPLESPQ